MHINILRRKEIPAFVSIVRGDNPFNARDTDFRGAGSSGVRRARCLVKLANLNERVPVGSCVGL